MPSTITLGQGCGILSNRFAFQLHGSSGAKLVVNASGDLVQWAPLATNMLTTAPLYLTDTFRSNTPARFCSATLLNR